MDWTGLERMRRGLEVWEDEVLTDFLLVLLGFTDGASLYTFRIPLIADCCILGV